MIGISASVLSFRCSQATSRSAQDDLSSGSLAGSGKLLNGSLSRLSQYLRSSSSHSILPCSIKIILTITENEIVDFHEIKVMEIMQGH